MRLERIVPGRTPSGSLAGAILPRDVVVGGERWPKGRRLSAGDIERLCAIAPKDGIGVLVPEAGDVHEDEAARRLARAMSGEGITIGEPVQSRVDLRASVGGVARIRAADLERLSAIDPIGAFSILDGQIVAPGDLIASVKVGPHLVPPEPIERGEAVARRAAPLVSVVPFAPRRVAALVKESLPPASRPRFEASVRSKVETLGSVLVDVVYPGDELRSLEEALRTFTTGADRVDVLLVAGASGSDPADPVFAGLAAVGGRVVRHGVPAHPGSMIWLGQGPPTRPGRRPSDDARGRADGGRRGGRTTIIGVPSCGAYSKATAVDLLLPWLLAGASPNSRTVARLAHGGVLTRSMRFRFPAYARELDAPDG